MFSMQKISSLLSFKSGTVKDYKCKNTDGKVYFKFKFILITAL